MKIEAFYRPETIDDALTLLDQTKDAKIIAGGTDIVIALNERKVKPRALIDITGINEMRRIWEENDTLHIGATVTFSELESNVLVRRYCPSLCDAASQMGAVQIRNLATIGGNVANAATAADGVPPLLSVNACAVVRSAGNVRCVPLSEIITCINQNALAANEMITEFQMKDLPNTIKIFEKIGRRKALAISRINVAVCGEINGRRVKTIVIVVGAVGKTSYRVKEVEDYLQDKELSELVIVSAAELMEETVARNLAGRSTTPYKRKIAGAVLKRSLERIAGGHGNE